MRWHLSRILLASAFALLLVSIAGSTDAFAQDPVPDPNTPFELSVSLAPAPGVDLPPIGIRWVVDNSFQSGVLGAGVTSTELVRPQDFARAAFILSPVPIGWLATADCTAPMITEQIAFSNGERRFVLDPLAASGEAQACVITLVPAEPVTLQIELLATGASNTLAYASTTSEFFRLDPSGVVTRAIPSADFQLKVSWEDGTDMSSVRCIGSGFDVTSTPDPVFPTIRADLPPAPPGSTISCEVVGESQPNRTVQVVHRAQESPGAIAPGTFRIGFTGTADSMALTESGSRFDLAFNGIGVGLEPIANRALVDVQCTGAQWTPGPFGPGSGRVESFDSTFARCVFVTEPRVDPPVYLRIAPAFAALQGEPPVLYTVSNDRTYTPVLQTGSLFESVRGWNGFFERVEQRFTTPAGWSPQTVSCLGVDPQAVTLERGRPIFGAGLGEYELEVSLVGVSPGDLIDCTIELVAIDAADLRPLRFELIVDGEPNADVAVEFEVTSGATFGSVVVNTSELGVFNVPAGNTRAAITPVPLPGFVASGGMCFVATPTFTADGLGWGTFSPDWSFVPDPLQGQDVVCALRLLRIGPTSLTVRNATSAPAEFQITDPSGDVRVVVVAPQDEFQLPTASGKAAVGFVLGDGVELSEVACTRPAEVARAERVVELDVWPEEDHRCTFVENSLVGGQAGDADCGGVVDRDDIRAILEFFVQQRSVIANCPAGGTSAQIAVGAADIDGSGTVDLVDALFLAQCSVGSTDPLCPDMAIFEVE